MLRALAAKLADCFGIELIKIYLIGSNVPDSKIAKSAISLHPNVLVPTAARAGMVHSFTLVYGLQPGTTRLSTIQCGNFANTKKNVCSF